MTSSLVNSPEELSGESEVPYLIQGRDNNEAQQIQYKMAKPLVTSTPNDFSRNNQILCPSHRPKLPPSPYWVPTFSSCPLLMLIRLHLAKSHLLGYSCIELKFTIKTAAVQAGKGQHSGNENEETHKKKIRAGIQLAPLLVSSNHR